MDVVYSETHLLHKPRRFIFRGEWADNPEVPERAINLVAAARAAGHRVIAPDDFGPAPRRAVHEKRHLDFLESAHRRWSELDGAGPEIVPNTHPTAPFARYPESVVGQAGWHISDTACPIGPGTWQAACAGANVALHAAQLVLDGADAAYGLCRPPGHHAGDDISSGFCLLNNVAIAAQHMRAKLSKLAILDIDVHHGNGTQGIFYGRRDVLFVSVHADPTAFFPFYVGFEDERGEGEGHGLNHNLPLPKGSADNTYLDALAGALEVIGEYAPDMLLIALGFDGYEHDPFEGFAITTEGFGRIGAAIGELGLPTVFIQEGGYNIDDLGKNVTTFVEHFEAVHAGAIAERR